MSIDLLNSSSRRLDGLRLLSICTSTAKSSVFASKFNHGGHLAKGALVFQDQGRESATMIFRLIDEALKLADVGDFDVLAFDRGPGAFTGVRIGCGVAQGLGFGKSLPVVGVNALAAQALQIVRSKSLAGREIANEDMVCGVAIDARMNEVYCAAYKFKFAQGLMQTTILEPTVCSAEQAVLLFEDVRCEHVAKSMLVGGNGFIRDGLHQSLFEWASNLSSSNFEVVDSLALDAEKIALFAAATLQTRMFDCGSNRNSIEFLNDSYPAALAAPEYVRNNVALDKTQQAKLRLQRQVEASGLSGKGQ
jgi:tRNA threonylcarbamoyladenosine biosynthesis protein TsaB